MNSFLHTIDARVTPTTALRSKLEGLQFRELEPIDREDVPAEMYEYSQNACSQGFLGCARAEEFLDSGPPRSSSISGGCT